MKTKLLSTIAIALLTTTIGAQTLWDENVDGDLSNDNTNPSGAFVLEIGSTNTVIASQMLTPRDVDFFSFTVPENSVLQELIIEDYVSSDSTGFMGIDSGLTTDVDFMSPNPSVLLGGTTYGTSSIGNDILPAMGNLSGAEGFTPPLAAGDYTIWLNQTGSVSEVTINLVLEEVLSVNDNSLTNSISLFPNPAQNFIEISSSENIENVTLYNVLGKEVMTTSNSTNLNIASLASGIYLAHITTPAGIVTKKVIKQ